MVSSSVTIAQDTDHQCSAAEERIIAAKRFLPETAFMEMSEAMRMNDATIGPEISPIAAMREKFLVREITELGYRKGQSEGSHRVPVVQRFICGQPHLQAGPIPP